MFLLRFYIVVTCIFAILVCLFVLCIILKFFDFSFKLDNLIILLFQPDFIALVNTDQVFNCLLVLSTFSTRPSCRIKAFTALLFLLKDSLLLVVLFLFFF